MAGAHHPAAKGGKKLLDAEINLVPFIDLLSCCISFLLITAVWTQIAGLQVASSGGPPGPQQKQGQTADPKLPPTRSEEHTPELQSQSKIVCRLLLEKK